MSTAIQTQQGKLLAIDPEAISKLILNGDLSGLTPNQKVQYYNKVCETVGLNPLTKPFDYMKFQGKEVLYANKGCAEQLRMVHRISLKVVSREKIDDVYVVTAEASFPDGRIDGSTGAVPLLNLKGNDLANAMMKAETKAKRRVTLSICGLNMLDETEVETVRGGVYPEQPILDGPVTDGVLMDKGYVIDFGKWNRKTVEQVYRDEGADEIINYISYLETTAEKKGQTIDPKGKVGIFILNCETFLGAMENTPESDGPAFGEPGEGG